MKAPTIEYRVGHVIDRLKEMPAGSVHTVITSPPYFSQRAYQTPPQIWGGRPDCKHRWGKEKTLKKSSGGQKETPLMKGRSLEGINSGKEIHQGAFCRCGAWRGELGREPTMGAYIAHLVEVFRAVRRVLRPDGVAWVNIGDAFSTGGFSDRKQAPGDIKGAAVGRAPRWTPPPGTRAKTPSLIPFRLTLALQDDGWLVKAAIVWAKGISFCDGFAGAVMPESVFGWKWEQHRVKVRGAERGTERWRTGANPEKPRPAHDGHYILKTTKWKPCPGCPKCSPNDGLVLRRGSWRPTSSHEYILIVTKSQDYYCDEHDTKERTSNNTHSRGPTAHRLPKVTEPGQGIKQNESFSASTWGRVTQRNIRSVWVLKQSHFEGPHYACFPEDLPRHCISISTPSKGVCPQCGAPWARIMSVPEAPPPQDYGGKGSLVDGAEVAGRRINARGRALRRLPGADHDNPFPPRRTLGWRPTCGCGETETAPATVLDPFAGSGTTLAVARELGRSAIGIDLNPAYKDLATKRARLNVPSLEQATGEE